MLRRDLSNLAWTVQPCGDDSAAPAGLRARVIPARIPGCIHTDLIRAGLLGDPRLGMNERDGQWVGWCDWEYRATFDTERGLTSEHERLDLVFDGLDTIAEITLNGRELGRAANMFHPHRFDARGAIRAGANDLAITFRSPLRHIRAEESRLGARPYNGDGLGEAWGGGGGWVPFQFIRKAACNFGWDWGPRLATCGLWKPVRLEAWSVVRISAARPLVRREDDRRWRVDIDVDLDWASSSPSQRERAVGEGADLARAHPSHAQAKSAPAHEPPLTIAAILQPRSADPASAERNSPPSASHALTRNQPSATLTFRIHDPLLWNPRGHGEQHLDTLDLFIAPTDNPAAALDSCDLPLAFREVRLNTDPDEHGSRFQLEVNGKPIFCKGANWIPEGLFPDDRTPERLRTRLQQAAAANMNMIRVWGGGLYESDEFYSECDRLGLMVWQDFMFACAMYPEEPPFPALIEAEARHHIARLASHPSVVLWCGGNECIWGHENWGWKERLAPGQTWGAGYFLDLLPRLVQELDPTRPYWPNSPYSGMAAGGRAALRAAPPNDPQHGDRHAWDAKLEGYRALIPRFISEVGHQSPSNLPTLERVLKPEDLTISPAGEPSPALEHRQRATGGTQKHINESMSERQLELGGGSPAFTTWHTRAQQLQADAMTIAIEHALDNHPRCTGILIWQLNDAWPGFSWSLIDSDGREKPAYFAVQRAFTRHTIP